MVAALVLSTTPAFAGNGNKGDWEIGGYAGQGWLDNYGPFHPGDDVFYGGRLGYFVSRFLSLEATGQRLPTASRTFPGTNMNINSYRGNAVINLPITSRFKPFLTLGAGYENTEIAGFDNSSGLAVNGGAGFRVFVAPWLGLRADGRYNWNKVDALDEAQNNFELSGGLSAYFGGGGDEDVQETMPPPAPNQPPVISLVPDRSQVLPGENVTLTATATDPEGGPVTLDWSATNGRVNGSGNSATLSIDGTSPPATATVTVRGTDDHGNSSTAQAAVNVVEPARPAEATSCMAGGFSRNMARLTNVDKACLDDMSMRLKSDMRAHIVVIGHTDPREASRVGDQRAAAVKDYLQQTGIDDSRIRVRSAGNSKSGNKGTDMSAQTNNRRVEVWFVPEGANEPE